MPNTRALVETEFYNKGRHWAIGFIHDNLPITYQRLGMVAQNATNASSTTSGNANFRIGVYGDSLTRSPSDLYYNPVTDQDGYRQGTALNQRAFHTAMAKAFSSAGYPANTDAFQGLAIYTNISGFVAVDGLVKFGAGWGITTQDTSGGYFVTNTTDTSAISMKPTKAYDTIEVYTFVQTAGGTNQGKFTVTVNGVTSSEYGGGFQNAYKIIIPVEAQAAGTIFTLNRTGSGGGLYVLGMRTRLSTLGEVEITNMGRNSGSSITLNSSAAPYSPLPMLSLRADHLVIYAMGVNDWNPPNTGSTTPVTSLENYIANVQAFIDAAKAAGSDVILLGMPQSNSAAAGISSVEVQESYIDALRSLAITNNCPFIDFQHYFGSWSQACQRGFIARISNGSGGLTFDNKHISLMGANEIGRIIVNMILNNPA